VTLARTRSVTLLGVAGVLVEVEAYLGNGLPGFTIVGLPDASLNESRDRVRAAVVNSGEHWPQRRITVGLSPASVHKRGSSFDLAVACAVLTAAGALPPDQVDGLVLLGELGLDGRVHTVRGVLPSVLTAASSGLSKVVVPAVNAAEARLVPDMSVAGVRSLAELLALLRGELNAVDEAVPVPSARHGEHGAEAAEMMTLGPGEAATIPSYRGPSASPANGLPSPASGPPSGPPSGRTVAAVPFAKAAVIASGSADTDPDPPDPGPASAAGWTPDGSGSSVPRRLPDLADVRGQFAGRRALEICAAGGHHLFLRGAPGAGKTMLAERLPGLLPELDRETALEVTAIHSVAGLLPPDRPLITTPPFFAPHHTASLPALVGGGSSLLRPGAVTLAHRGVLFIDDAMLQLRTPQRGLRYLPGKGRLGPGRWRFRMGLFVAGPAACSPP
jgi:magnesium chelatase family protein